MNRLSGRYRRASVVHATPLHAACLAAAIVLAGCGRSVPVLPVKPTPPTPPTPPIPTDYWRLKLDYIETPGSPGDAVPSAHVWFSVSSTGAFSVELSEESTSGDRTGREGYAATLGEKQIKQLADTVKAVDPLTLGRELVELGENNGTEGGGWSGSVTFARPGARIAVPFTSSGGYPVDPDAQKRVDRAGVLLWQLKVLARIGIARSRLPEAK